MTELPSNCKTSALRVFLTCARQETRDMLEKYQARAAIDACFSLSNYSADYWSSVTTLLHKLQSYIDNCLRSNGAELCYGLSAIGAVQEGLVAAISSSNRQYGHNNHKILMEEHTLRAKLIVNGSIAQLRQDFELESLWLLAAKRVHRQIEQIRLDKTNNTSTHRSRILKTNEYLTKAATHDKQNENGHVQQAELRRLISRQFRRAAVCTLLDRKHPHVYAAETYQIAASFCVFVPTSHNCELWQNAVAAMRLAGDMITAHTDESSAKKDTLITQTIATARQFVDDARQVSQLVCKVKEIKSRLQLTKEAIVKCKDASSKPVLHLLVEKQEILLDVTEKHLHAVMQGESMTSAAKELQAMVSKAEREASILHNHIQNLRGLTQSVEYFRRKALEGDSITHRELAPLLRQCWIKAAEVADIVKQLNVERFQEGMVTQMTLPSIVRRNRCYEMIENYVQIAETVLVSAVEYLDKARGAEVGEKNGRDPREAQLWRKAAECVVKEAKQALIDNVTDTDQTNPWVPVGYLQHQQSLFALAAEYLSRSYSYKHKPTTCALPQINAVRASSLYEKLAKLQIAQICIASSSDKLDCSLEQSVLNCTFDFIGLLTSAETVSNETILHNERACEYGHRYLRAAYTHADSALIWSRAVKLYLGSISPGNSQHQDKVFQSVNPREAAAAAVYALAAEAKETGRAQFAAACVHAGVWLTMTHSRYYVALAQKIIVVVDSSFPSDAPVDIPSELLRLPSEDFDPTFESLLEVHAAAYIKVSECECQLRSLLPGGPTARAWEDAQNAVLKLTSQLSLYVNNLRSETRTPSAAAKSDGLLAYFQATAECYYAVAKLCSAGEAKQNWSKAVEMCKLAERMIGNDPGQRGMATTAIELHSFALQAQLAGDLELSTLWSNAAYKARSYLEQRGTDKYGIAESASKHAELAAQAMAAQRQGHTKLCKLWNDAALCWQALEKSLRDTKDLRGYAINASQPSVRRREADRLEALARAAHTAPDDALKGDGEDEPREGSAFTVDAAAGATAAVAAVTTTTTTLVPFNVPNTLSKRSITLNGGNTGGNTRFPVISKPVSSVFARVTARGDTHLRTIALVGKKQTPSNSAPAVPLISRVVPAATALGTRTGPARTTAWRTLTAPKKTATNT